MLRAPGNVILEVGPHLISALLDFAGTPDTIAVSADRKIRLPGGAEVFRRWRIHSNVGRMAADININLGPGFDQRTIVVRGLLGSATVDFDANTCLIDRRTPLSSDLDHYKRSRSLAKQLTSQARKTLADYILSKLKLRQRGNPYQISMLDSVAAFYSALHTDTAVDRRLDGNFGRNVIEWCTKIVQAAQIVPAEAPISSGRKIAAYAHRPCPRRGRFYWSRVDPSAAGCRVLRESYGAKLKRGAQRHRQRPSGNCSR